MQVYPVECKFVSVNPLQLVALLLEFAAPPCVNDGWLERELDRPLELQRRRETRQAQIISVADTENAPLP